MKALLSRNFAILFVVLLSFPFMSILPANAGMLIPYPIEPNNDPLIITIETPTHKTYNTQNITLTFTITKPDTWTWGEDTVACTFDRINEISYFLDGKKEVSYLRLKKNYLDNGIDRLPKISHYSLEVNKLFEGSHVLTIEVISEHEYKSASDPDTYLYTPHSINSKTTTSNPVIFNHATNTPTPKPTLEPSTTPTSTPEPTDVEFPVLIVASIIIIVIGSIGILTIGVRTKRRS